MTINKTSKLQAEVKLLKAKLTKINKQLILSTRTLTKQKAIFKKELEHKLLAAHQQASHKAQALAKQIIVARDKASSDATTHFDRINLKKLTVAVVPKKASSHKKKLSTSKIKRNGKAHASFYSHMENRLM